MLRNTKKCMILLLAVIGVGLALAGSASAQNSKPEDYEYPQYDFATTTTLGPTGPMCSEKDMLVGETTCFTYSHETDTFTPVPVQCLGTTATTQAPLNDYLRVETTFPMHDSICFPAYSPVSNGSQSPLPAAVAYPVIAPLGLDADEISQQEATGAYMRGSCYGLSRCSASNVAWTSDGLKKLAFISIGAVVAYFILIAVALGFDNRKYRKDPEVDLGFGCYEK